MLRKNQEISDVIAVNRITEELGDVNEESSLKKYRILSIIKVEE